MEQFVPVEKNEIVPGDCCKFQCLEVDLSVVGTREWSVNVYNSRSGGGAFSGRSMRVGWDEIFMAIPYPKTIRHPTLGVRGHYFLHSSGRIFIVYDFPIEKLCTV